MINIGITLRTIKNDINIDIDKLSHSLIEYLNFLNANVILIPNISDITFYLNICDGFIIPGGVTWNDADIKVLKYAYSHDLPVLGICAGMQLIASSKNFDDNTYFLSNDKHYKLDTYVHEIRINNGLLKDILKKDYILVNSRHHEAILVDDYFHIDAISSDGVVEAISLPQYKFVLGLQWHPEDINDDNSKMIFKYFINKCK